MHNLIGLSMGLASAARARGIKTVLTVHDYWVFCHKNTRIFADGSVCDDFTRCAHCMPYIHDGRPRAIPIRMRNDFLLTQASRIDCVLSPSQHMADAYIQAGVPASRMRVLWHGVDVERFSRVQKLPVDRTACDLPI